jgi:hypothetical protein
LNVAVVSFCILFYVMMRFTTVPDLQPAVTEGFSDEG